MTHADVLRLVLYVTGDTTRSAAAIANLQEIQKLLNGQCEITVIDVLEHPELAEREKILATPTLVKVSPPPLRRLIGDLSDQALVVSLLDLGGGFTVPKQSIQRL
ncbi:MAG: circadian clock KaiB family protein [Caldilinea sp.]|nr:circadian clock KaiB family protein [Caldilinea sp.]MCB0055619.1 circadian clock KaiB family protein [Caldilineaceae bacterium]MCB0050591.1 circadian clock KaiB family protein [Caldilinea sp.]MCB0148989.1 circadian clock KaiB family protein [Caldilineaceae bacterium]MCB9115680.1 circadian clock protein KaiB [Caldilineaceae bacterium]